MNELCSEIGYLSLSKYNEQLCGDHIDVIDEDHKSKIIVLSDGLGSGVKASILSILTSKIISTMLVNNLSIEECLEAITATLPICSQRNIAYSTFTIIHLINNEEIEIIEYDNPQVILIRNNKIKELNKKMMIINDKKIYHTKLKFEENDYFILYSDGCLYASRDSNLNYDWQENDIGKFMADMSFAGLSAKTLAKILIEECNKLYGFNPGDDLSACVIKIRKRKQVNLMFGPAENKSDDQLMMSLFFAKEGKHIISGGTTAKVAAKYLNKKIIYDDKVISEGIPPLSKLDGVDLVSEGVITIDKVLTYAKDYLEENQLYQEWEYNQDAASQIARLLFEDATDINFFVGKAVNPISKSKDINFNLKVHLIDELTNCLKKMGKRVKISIF